MKKTMKIWSALGAAALTASSAQAMPIMQNKSSMAASYILTAESAGEAGESGAVSVDGMDPMAADQQFLANLGLVEGHLRVGVALYALGAIDHAKTHMKHPESELYQALLPEFEEHGGAGFVDELAAIGVAVETGKPVAEIEKQLTDIIALIDQSGAPDDLESRAKAITIMVQTAAKEYAFGVQDGVVVDAHEYQDAWGFVQAAKRMALSVSEADRTEYNNAFAKIIDQLELLASAWPDLTGNAPVNFEPSLMAGAAARIEIASLSIK